MGTNKLYAIVFPVVLSLNSKEYCENIFNELDINAITETRNNISDLINWGTSTYFDKKYEIDNKKQTREVLIQDIEKLKNGINPYDSQFINFKAMLEARLKQKFCKDIEVSILADLLEIKDARWQNAIEGYLNTQKKYFNRIVSKAQENLRFSIL